MWLALVFVIALLAVWWLFDSDSGPGTPIVRIPGTMIVLGLWAAMFFFPDNPYIIGTLSAVVTAVAIAFVLGICAMGMMGYQRSHNWVIPAIYCVLAAVAIGLTYSTGSQPACIGAAIGAGSLAVAGIVCQMFDL